MRQHAQGHCRALNRSRGGGAFLKQSVLTVQGSAGAACRLLVGLHHTSSRAGMRCRPRPSIVDVLELAWRYACIEHVQVTWCPFGIDFSSLHFAARRHVNPFIPTKSDFCSRSPSGHGGAFCGWPIRQCFKHGHSHAIRWRRVWPNDPKHPKQSFGVPTPMQRPTLWEY